jgi:hypothetical protein
MQFLIRDCRCAVPATCILFLNSLCCVVCPLRISKGLSRAMDSNAIFKGVTLNYFFSFSLLQLFWFLSLFIFCVILGLTDLIWHYLKGFYITNKCKQKGNNFEGSFWTVNGIEIYKYVILPAVFYGCKTLKFGWRMFKIKVLTIFEIIKEKETKGAENFIMRGFHECTRRI